MECDRKIAGQLPGTFHAALIGFVSLLFAGVAHVLLILSFVFGNGIFSLESAVVITGIPSLLFLSIGQTSASLRS